MALIHDEASYTDVTIYTLQHSRALDVATGYKSFGVFRESKESSFPCRVYYLHF